MDSIPFTKFFEQSTCILGEGAVIERLRRDSEFELDPDIVNSAFIYEEAKRNAIETIYRQYLDIGAQYGLPLLLSTPTWRASQERIASAGFAHKDVNGDNFRYLDALRSSYGEYARNVIICGLLSCRGNAYDQADALTADDAFQFHSWQATKLAESGVDFLLAATLPALSEATGLARALAETGISYIVSFVARPEGTLLDGTPLKDALAHIDGDVHPRPLAYMINCTHASNFKSALMDEDNSSSSVRSRIVGLLANTAALTPEELDSSDTLVEEAPEVFGKSVAGLRADYGMKVLGGCCGTDDRHIRCLAEQLSQLHSH